MQKFGAHFEQAARKAVVSMSPGPNTRITLDLEKNSIARASNTRPLARQIALYLLLQVAIAFGSSPVRQSGCVTSSPNLVVARRLSLPVPPAATTRVPSNGRALKTQANGRDHPQKETIAGIPPHGAERAPIETMTSTLGLE
jgi:hypothetical protein